MTKMRAAAVTIGTALVVAAAGIGAAVGHADPETTETPSAPAEPTTSAGTSGHQVTYTITTTSDLVANISYIEADPPSMAAYNADSAKYLHSEHTPISGGKPLVFTVSLDDPNQWALVTASGGLRINPEFHCEIAVDGQSVVSVQGGSGVTCSTRPW